MAYTNSPDVNGNASAINAYYTTPAVTNVTIVDDYYNSADDNSAKIIDNYAGLLGAASGGLLCSISFLGNSILIGVICITKSFREPFYIVVTSQAANDLLFAWLGTVFTHIYTRQEFALGLVWCQIVRLGRAVIFANSLFHISYLTAWRYLAVVFSHRLQWARSSKAAVLGAGLVWTISILLGSGATFRTAAEEDHSTAVPFNILLMTCPTSRSSSNTGFTATIYTVLAVYFATAVLIACAYIHMHLVDRRSQQRVSQMTVAERKRTRRETRLLKVMVMVTSLFLVSFLSSNVIANLERFGLDISQYVYMFAVMALYLSPSSNWLIYGYGLNRFKRKLLDLLKCRVCRRPAQVHPNNVEMRVAGSSIETVTQ